MLESSPNTSLPPLPAPQRGFWLLAAVLLLTHVFLVFHCSVEDFATYDEIGNLYAGIWYWQTGSYRLYNVNPPLPKLLSALPVFLARPNTRPITIRNLPASRPEWDYGARFARENASRYHDLVVIARSVGLVWSVLGALGVYCWARALWGRSSGLLALAVWCFEPNIIAHAHLIPADLPAAVAGLWAAYVFRRYLLAPSWPAALLAGIVLGVAESCKFTLLVFYPLWCVLWLVFALRRRWGGTPGVVAGLGQLALLLGVSLCVLNLCYQFAGTGKRLKEFPFVSETLAGPREQWTGNGNAMFGNRFARTSLGELVVLVPEDMLRGIDVQRKDFEVHASREGYLHGEWQQNGWWYFYLYAAAVKVPLGLWGLLLLALFWPLLSKSAGRTPWAELLVLGSPALVLFAFVSFQTSIQNLRYLLPAFPFVVVFLGRVGQVFDGVRCWPKLVILALLIWAVASSLIVHPHALSYFNELAGGPDNGHNHLLGSHVDWGQDLFRLKRWLAKHPEATPLHLAYCNHIDPRILGIDFELPPPGLTGAGPEDPQTGQRLGPLPGYFAVSVRLVHGSQTTVPDGNGRYRLMPFRSLEYFQQCEPIARVGYSIFLYHITVEEANAVRLRTGLPLLPPESRE